MVLPNSACLTRISACSPRISALSGFVSSRELLPFEACLREVPVFDVGRA